MEKQRQIYSNFMCLNAHKAACTEVPTAHVMFYKDGGVISPLQPLISMTIDDVLEELDRESELVRWLLNQMSTYDPRKQKIVALVFDRQTVLSDVLCG